MAGVPWSGEDLATLRTAWAESTPVPAIADRLGRTDKAVQVKACHLGLSRRGPPGRPTSYPALRTLKPGWGVSFPRERDKYEQVDRNAHLLRLAVAKLKPKKFSVRVRENIVICTRIA